MLTWRPQDHMFVLMF